MSRLDELPADQRAVLSLVLEKGRGYRQIADLLTLDEAIVRERAHAALDALGPRDGTPPPAPRRAATGDYLLGQQSAEQSAETRGYLESSAAGRAWARVLAAELRPLATDDLPAIPAERAAPAAPAPEPGAPAGPASSRRGGAILLGGLAAIAVAVLLIVLLSGGGGGGKKHRVSTTPAAPTTQTKVLAQINLLPPNHASRPLGVATLVQQGSAEGLALQAVGLPATSSRVAYAVWLYNSHASAQRIGFTPAVKRDGKLGAIAPAPQNLSQYRAIIVTRETNAKGTRPGPIVLSGALPSHSLKP